MKNSLVLFSDPCSRAMNPGFVVFWTGFEVLYSCFRLPIGPTTTFSTGSLVFDTGYRACVPDRSVGEQVSAMSSSRKPAVPKVSTYRILTQVGEYLAPGNDPGAGRRGACSGLSTPGMSMQKTLA